MKSAWGWGRDTSRDRDGNLIPDGNGTHAQKVLFWEHMQASNDELIEVLNKKLTEAFADRRRYKQTLKKLEEEKT